MVEPLAGVRAVFVGVAGAQVLIKRLQAAGANVLV